MAGNLVRMKIAKYAVLELNQVAFRRDGRIEAQCKIGDLGNDKDGNAITYIENGMLLAVDQTNRVVKYPDVNAELIGLNYTTEHMYDERATGLNNFKLEKNSFLPRIGYLAAGDKFTTNCIAYDDSEFVDAAGAAVDSALKDAINNVGTNPLYGKECANGAIQITATKPEGAVCLKVVCATTLPNGDYAVKFVSLK